jgi:UDP-N-acetylglucosamine diphosphorylase/glucosamine-1-phosphate N-acetyltransferase
VTGKENLFLEEGARINAGSIINATTGPVYLARNSEIMEGCMVRGPLAIGENAALKMGAKIYGATTIGFGCKAGGEISNVVFFANSNKGHDGFLGNAVIGEWCNLGADTNGSNLKNNYDEVKIWDEHNHKLVKTNLTFCGVLMGDHSKCGINTMFNTGTVVGVSCNIYGGDFPEKFIPSFSWGGSDGFVTYDFNKAMETAERMMQRRGKKLTHAEKEMYRYIFSNKKNL